MLQITQTSKGFLKNGPWPNMRYCHYFIVITFYKGVTKVLSSHPPGETEESKNTSAKAGCVLPRTELDAF